MAVIIFDAVHSSEAGSYFFKIMSNFVVERIVSFWLVAVEACVQSWPSLCDLWRKKWDLCRHFSNYFGFSACRYHSTKAPYSSSSTCCSYQDNIWPKLGTLQKALFFQKPRKTE